MTAIESSVETSRPATHRNVDVLLVDDRHENLLALEAILEPLGLHLIRAMSGEEALREVLRRDLAVILLDVQMPGMNGFETAKVIKSRERSRHIPIIFLTAISKEEQYVFEGYSVGAVDYLSKPFHPDVLRSKVSVFVELHEKGRQLREQEQQLRLHERREIELQHRVRLSESEARMAEVVESAIDAIVMFDESQRVTLFNAAAERVFGFTAKEALGREIGEFFPEDYRSDFIDRVCANAPVARPGRAHSHEMPRIESALGVRKSGETFPIECSVSCLELADGKVYTIIARDITERVRVESELRHQATTLANTMAELKSVNDELARRQVDLEKAITARSRFYASMSHELRTPINAILGYNTLLLDHIYGPLNERQTQGVRRAHKAAKHLLELVNDVLDLSKIEAGKIELQLQPVAFPTLIEDLFVTVRPLADERRSDLSLVVEGPPRKIISDPRRVRQILLNLLSNAIKFGGGNPIRVIYSADEHGGVRVEVEDRGVGIAAEDIPKIFDEFVQLQKTHNEQGTGLGLPISSRLATLLNGKLEVESTPGEGSTFRLTLPANVDQGRSPGAGVPLADLPEVATRTERQVASQVFQEGPRPTV
ncbi:MAG TPA: ATP-binding protein [Gemmatimonadaceae bacterium]|nr:ATP-binding protein [Gemmatimonadaceae bacterium]